MASELVPDGDDADVVQHAIETTEAQCRFGTAPPAVQITVTCGGREGARDLLTDVPPWFNWLRKLWVDGGYSGEAFAQWVKTIGPKLEVEVVKRSDTAQGFEVLPRRWVVERTIGWLMRQRRLARDYEATEQSAAAFIFIAMIRIQLRRLA